MGVDKPVEKYSLERDLRRIGTILKHSAATFSNLEQAELSAIVTKEITFRGINFSNLDPYFLQR